MEQYIRKIVDCNVEGVHSDLIYRDVKGKVIRRWRMGEGDIRRGWLPGHPTLYLKREVYEKYGGYKEDYRCAADYEFMVRIMKDGKVKLAYIPETLIAMLYGGTSNSGLKAYLVSFKEGIRALKENNIGGAYWITLLRIFKVIMQFK